jgi:mRNA interferase MazF
MGLFAADQVVLVRFPFSDLTASKLRPPVVLAEAGRGDWILCQITSKSYGDPKTVSLDAADFAHGSLRAASFARPGKLFTADSSLVANKIGTLHPVKFSEIRDAVVRMIQKGS